MPNLNQLVNAGDLDLGIYPKSKLLPPGNKVRDPWKQHGDTRKFGEAGGFHKLAKGAVPQAATLVEKLSPTKRPSETGVYV